MKLSKKNDTIYSKLKINLLREAKRKMDFTEILELIILAAGLGVALAMDAFSVSLANGLNEPCMKKTRMCGIAGIFALFQGVMPLIGWFCVRSLATHFKSFEKLIPWIALVLLLFIGGKMLIEGIQNKEEDCCSRPGLTLWALIVQGVATSIDALSVGFTIEEYTFKPALLVVSIIAVLTFFICMFGLALGKKVGTRFSGKAGILGGAILIFIGITIFVRSFI